VFPNYILWGWAFYDCVAACSIHLPFLKTADTLAALNNCHGLRHQLEGCCRRPRLWKI